MSEEPPAAPLHPTTAFALERLSKALGPTRGLEILSATLAEIGLREIETPQQLLDFSEHLIAQGGMLRAVGRGLKMRAVLRGAVESA